MCQLVASVAVSLGVLQAALNGIYQAALYRFTQTGQAPDGFDQGQMEGAFLHKD